MGRRAADEDRAATANQSETRVLERLAAVLPPAPEGETWIGDDTAVVRTPPGALLLTADTVVAGVHADLSLVGLDDLGWKAMAASVSDVAAMGGSPERALVTVAGPTGTDIDLLYEGLRAAAALYGCPIVGGDLVSAEALVVTVMVMGTTGAREPVLRSGARPGDRLLVTGPLGASAAGLSGLQARSRGPLLEHLARSHCRPQARLAEGRTASEAGVGAMIDVSDGLALDLDRMARASGVGIALDAVPVAEGASLEDALGGGEDYELVMAAADPVTVEEGFAAAGLSPPVRIGRCTADPAERRLRGAELAPTGWEHRW